MHLLSHHDPSAEAPAAVPAAVPDREVAARLVLVDDRPVPRAALAATLPRRDIDLVAVCDEPPRAECLLALRPDVLVLGNGSSPGLRAFLERARKAGGAMAVVVVAPSVDDVQDLRRHGLVDAVLGPEAGVEHLARLVTAVRAGDRMVAGVASRRPVASPCGVSLTPRESDVLAMLALGVSNEAISARLGITVNTVRTHVSVVLRKLGESRRVGAVRRAEELGLLDHRGIA